MLWLFLRLAFLNLWRHRRRTLLTLTSIACGCAVIMWMQSIIFGRNQNMIDIITSTYTGYLQIYHPDYLKTKLVNKSISEDQLQSKIIPQLGNTTWTPRLHLPTLISSGEESVPLQLEGIDPLREASITHLAHNLKSGEFLTAQDSCVRKEIYLGEAMADNLHVGLGEKLVVLTQATDGTLGNELFHVQGLFASGSPDFDKSIAFTHIRCAQDLAALKGYHEIVLKPQDTTAVDHLQSELQQKIPTFQVTTWRQAIPSVDTMIRYNDASLKMTIFILFTVITMGVINTLMMNLFERTKEFGVILSLGMTPRQLQLLVFLESSLLGLFGILAGTILGAGLVTYYRIVGFDMSPFFGSSTGTDGFVFDLIIHPIFQWLPYLKVAGWELIFLMLAGFYPAWKVSQMRPVEILRA